jgi:protein Mpv17
LRVQNGPLADGIAQVQAFSKSDDSIEMRRNLAYVLYGGIFIGMMCHIEYDVVFPMIFGTEQTVETIIQRVLFDVFISAPFLWLPPAYLVKAVIYDYSFKEGLEKYWSDIQNGLLLKYWALWLPALSFSFSTVPDHLRVAFMAFISFFWFIIFSSSVAENEAAQADDQSSRE